jgi:hypothetical protein
MRVEYEKELVGYQAYFIYSEVGLLRRHMDCLIHIFVISIYPIWSVSIQQVRGPISFQHLG